MLSRLEHILPLQGRPWPYSADCFQLPERLSVFSFLVVALFEDNITLDCLFDKAREAEESGEEKCSKEAKVDVVAGRRK